MPNYRRAYTEGGTYFFTLVTHQRTPIFTENVFITELKNAIKEVKLHSPFDVKAWVVLPDHMPFVWSLPPGDSNYSKRIGKIKVEFTKRIKAGVNNLNPQIQSKLNKRESNIWQRRFWEHEIRNQSDLQKHVDYVHYNPVKHGLVKNVVDWPYSTFHKYVRTGVYHKSWAGSADTLSQSFGE